ncbi:nucleotidyltransferase domain-containing protein [Auraticoccus monumenti]|uniref:Predicted nucleotidyltransferase n=1 Tax=Auraticoccus monumenti TaxID=675864 RepID=A0A1G6RNP3_9ACTN|nr:nucleotidyltransferase domain-containing protein [Auraticoccus monumenti]SDD05556.1 Predicted nucleotidyltransferase [Auraticoccus monumenti]
MTSHPSPDPLAGAPLRLRRLVDELIRLPGVEALALGGSRASGTHRADSDWDLGVYYRDGFRPADVRALGHPGTVVELGEWGGGIFNGGAWLDLDGTRVDLLWRELAVVEHEIDEAVAGRWRIEPLMFHLTGIPTYLLLAELAVNRVLHGDLPRPDYPSALREAAGRGWFGRAELTLGFARSAHAAQSRLTACLGLVAVGAAELAHAAAATGGRWVTNDKSLLALGGMDGVDALLRALPGDPSPQQLQSLVDATVELGRQAMAGGAGEDVSPSPPR